MENDTYKREEKLVNKTDKILCSQEALNLVAKERHTQVNWNGLPGSKCSEKEGRGRGDGTDLVLSEADLLTKLSSIRNHLEQRSPTHQPVVLREVLKVGNR